MDQGTNLRIVKEPFVEIPFPEIYREIANLRFDVKAYAKWAEALGEEQLAWEDERKKLVVEIGRLRKEVAGDHGESKEGDLIDLSQRKDVSTQTSHLAAKDETSAASTAESKIPGSTLSATQASHPRVQGGGMSNAINPFAAFQEGNFHQVCRTKAKIERETTMNEMKLFANRLILSTPVPKDIMLIIAKNPAKQKKLEEKGNCNAEEVRTDQLKAATNMPGSTKARQAPSPALDWQVSSTLARNNAASLGFADIGMSIPKLSAIDNGISGNLAKPVVKLPQPAAIARAKQSKAPGGKNANGSSAGIPKKGINIISSPSQALHPVDCVCRVFWKVEGLKNLMPVREALESTLNEHRQ